MSFDQRDLRAGMDVFGADGVYLGAVVRVRWRQRAGASDSQRGKSARQPAGAAVGTFSGERLGPMPTWEIGNAGPALQSPGTAYASQRTQSAPAVPRIPTELLVFRWLVSLNWATARPVLRRVPAELVQLVALERIVLSVNADELA